MDGFIDNERFASHSIEGRVLSLSTCRDEKSSIRWRTPGGHHGVQENGRTGIFADYHLRVADVAADDRPPVAHALRDQRLDETDAGAAKAVTITEFAGMPDAALNGDGLLDQHCFESLYNPGKFLLLVSLCDAATANGWTPPKAQRHRLVCIIRDYGMFDRREAPQYYPPAGRG